MALGAAANPTSPQLAAISITNQQGAQIFTGKLPFTYRTNQANKCLQTCTKYADLDFHAPSTVNPLYRHLIQ